MSTNYGFRCRECGISEIIDNCRSFNVPQLVDLLNAMLENTVTLSPLFDIGVGVNLQIDGIGYVTDEVRFIIDHRAKGHTVVVADEYGREWGQCTKRGQCDHCGHDGPCQPKTKVTP